MTKHITQEQRDSKNAKLRASRAAAKAAAKAAATAACFIPIPILRKRTAAIKVTRKPGSGGARSNSGKQVAASDVMIVKSFRCTPSQGHKFDALGAGEWARARIDAGTVK